MLGGFIKHISMHTSFQHDFFRIQHDFSQFFALQVGIWQPSALKENSLEEGKSITKFKEPVIPSVER